MLRYWSPLRYSFPRTLFPRDAENLLLQQGVGQFLYYGCISMLRYWSPLRYSFPRTLFPRDAEDLPLQQGVGRTSCCEPTWGIRGAKKKYDHILHITPAYGISSSL